MLVKPEVKEPLICCKKPHKPAAPETVSLLIKDELSRAGVNVSLFKAHVGRSLFPNKAKDIEISVLYILIRSGWKMTLSLRYFILKIP